MAVILLQFEYEGQISGFFLHPNQEEERKKERKKEKLKN